MAEEGTAPLTEEGMKIRVSLPTYKLLYEEGSEDMVWHDWGRDREDMVARARLREEERRKSRFLLL